MNDLEIIQNNIKNGRPMDDGRSASAWWDNPAVYNNKTNRWEPYNLYIKTNPVQSNTPRVELKEDAGILDILENIIINN